MNATAALRGLLRTPRAGPMLRLTETGEVEPALWGWHARAENVRNILCQSGYSMARISAITRDRFGIGSPYFIPPTFLYKLRTGITPHVCQIAALSESTGYRFVDWLQLFGFDLPQIPRLQMRLHTERTVLVTPVEGGESFLPQTYSGHEAFSRSYPFSGFPTGDRKGRCLFAKIGYRDSEVLPLLRPGSIVRIKRNFVEGECRDHGSTGDRLWLVELPGGLTCCQLRWIDRHQIVLLPNRLPWGCWPLRMPTEARILGVVDADHEPRYAAEEYTTEQKEYRTEQKETLSNLLRVSRARSGMTFRSAHGLTRTIAQILGNKDYAIALGMLSDYEAMGKLPRHAAKVLSLCMVYCMDLWALLEAAGLYIDDSAKLPLPASDRLELRSDYFDSPSRHSQSVS